jgi:hypothetical protein
MSTQLRRRRGEVDIGLSGAAHLILNVFAVPMDAIESPRGVCARPELRPGGEQFWQQNDNAPGGLTADRG